MKWLSALVLFLSSYSLADSPPSWEAFTVISDNGDWSALIAPLGDSQQPWNDNWELSVYKGNFHPSKKPVWEAKYLPSGYRGGYLSNDGKLFSYVEYWFYENNSVVNIYSEQCTITKKGSFFNLKSGLEQTASHKLWLKRSGKISYVIKDDKPLLKIETVEGYKYVGVACN